MIQADGGTRTASITGACVAMVDALNFLQRKGQLKTDPLLGMVAAVSVGVYQGEPVLDLDYLEDSAADTDLNLVMNETGGLIEIQGTAEHGAFSEDELQSMLRLGKAGIADLIALQKAALAEG